MSVLIFSEMRGTNHPDKKDKDEQKFIGNVTREQYQSLSEEIKTVNLGENAFNFGGRTRADESRGLFPLFVSETEYFEKIVGNPPEVCVICGQITEYKILTPVDGRVGYTLAGQLCAYCRTRY